MSELSFYGSRKKILFVCCVVFLISAMALTLNVRTSNQEVQNHILEGKKELLKHIENSMDQSLRIVGNDDCPLRLLEAKVKEIPGSMFTELTGRTTDLINVSSVPEATLVNMSEKTITGFAIIIRDPKSRVTRGITRIGVSIAPGATQIVKRSYFVDQRRETVVDDKGQIRHSMTDPELAENYWLNFSGLHDMYAAVGVVNFDDGSRWIIKDGGEVR